MSRFGLIYFIALTAAFGWQAEEREPVPAEMLSGSKLELPQHNCVVEAPGERWSWHRSLSSGEDSGSSKVRYYAVAPGGALEFVFWVIKDESGHALDAAFMNGLKKQLAQGQPDRLEDFRHSPVNTPFAGSYRFAFARKGGGTTEYAFGYVGGTFRKYIFLVEVPAAEEPALFPQFANSFQHFNRKPY